MADECEHNFFNDGIKFWQPDDRPMSGGGAYRRKYAIIYRCRKCLSVTAKELDFQDNSYSELKFGATPMAPDERGALNT